MNSTVALTLFCLLSAHFGCPAAKPATDNAEIPDIGVYLKRFEYMDVDKILSNDRLLSSYINCYLNKGPCDQVASDLKKAIPVVAANGCTGCSDKQLQSIKKSLNVVKTKRVSEWAQLVKLYDPTGANLNKFTE